MMSEKSEPMHGQIIELHGGSFTVVDAQYDEDAADPERGHWHLTVVAKPEPYSYPRCPECGWQHPWHASETCSRGADHLDESPLARAQRAPEEKP